ncbi:transporter substrate-binding domain-containing protein [Prosthecomicrobium pneumaticum]|uniref:Polar amino acid transport system substrate-binding protein n=1 Tax=Prosthecomicrobium pneumaticum TaxID=81895 RepID=A0A7W9CVK7_9HYPH|nr:transporter substrate-binding domain-containing protein [Prosthecomicrobium pneumaticum]MBB5752730.1 polar amino acid transport system substrate-binding protein [Prosthecomicrobium pneumaticum]
MRNIAKTIAAGFGALSLAVAFAGTASAEGKLQEVLSRGKLIVGTGSTNPPWHFRDESNELVGFDIEMAKIVAAGLFDDPTKIEFVNQASDARIPNIVTDKVDITCQFVTITAARAQQVAFTIPYYREGVSLMLVKGGKYANYEAMKAAGSAVTVSVLQNVFAEDMVHAALPEATVDQFESVDLMYQALNSGRADAAATDSSSLLYYMKQNPDRYVDSGYSWNPQSYGCIVKQGDPDWLNFVNVALREAMTGTQFPVYKAAYEKWFGTSPAEPTIGFPAELR